MKKLWLLFSQVVTVLLACLFVLFVLFASGKEEMAMPTPPPDTLRSAAKAAAPAVVSIIINPEQPTTFTKTRNSKAQARPVGEDDEDEDMFSDMDDILMIQTQGAESGYCFFRRRYVF